MGKIMTILLTLALIGCTTSDPYGNFITSVNVDQQKLLTRESLTRELAGDAVKRLMELYPPAQTQLELKQVPSDAFGVALVKIIREEGYALREFKEKEGQLSTSPALSLRYVLDQAGEANLYFLTVFVGEKSITRPYRVHKDSLDPAGWWVVKE